MRLRLSCRLFVLTLRCSNRWSHIASPFVKRKAFGDGAFRPQYLSPMNNTPETKWADTFQNLSKSAEGMATSAKRKIGFEDVAANDEGDSKKSKSKKPDAKAGSSNKAAAAAPKKKAGGGLITKFVIPTDPDAVLAEVTLCATVVPHVLLTLVHQAAPAPAPPKVSEETAAKQGFFASMEKNAKAKQAKKAVEEEKPPVW